MGYRDMAFLILLIILGLFGYGYYSRKIKPKVDAAKGFKDIVSKEQYRIILTDPISGEQYILKSINGINHEFQYTTDPTNTLFVNNLDMAKKIASSLPQENQPMIQGRKNALDPWHTV